MESIRKKWCNFRIRK